MAAGYRSSIQLFTSDGLSSDKYYHDVGAIESGGYDYVSFEVEKTSGDGAVWIVYSEKYYGQEGSGSGQAYIASTSATGRIYPGFVIKSIQAFDVTQPCICLFEHFGYRGNKLATEVSVDDIRKMFPTGQCAGMSSAIAISGLWSLYTNPSFNGPHQDVDALNAEQDISAFTTLNDQVESIKLVRPS